MGMKNKINLRPIPAAPYFTVREHQFALRKETSWPLGELKTSLEDHLRVLFSIPPEFHFKLVEVSGNPKDSLDNINIKDHPETGIVWSGSQAETDALITLDMSYSFPILPASYDGVGAIYIDPQFSLGVDCGVCAFFFRDEMMFSFESQQPDNRLLKLLDLVLGDILQKGSGQVLREANYKAAVLNNLIEQSPHLSFVVANGNLRSKTMIVALCPIELANKIYELGYHVAVEPHGDSAKITIANYPTHSKELIEMFADSLALL